MKPLDEALRQAAATAESAWINSDSYSQHNEWPAVLKAALASLAADGWVPQQGWQPIETAPRNGLPVLIYPCGPMPDAGEGYFDTSTKHWFRVRAYREEGASYPTHWMPLPAAPKTGETP